MVEKIWALQIPRGSWIRSNISYKDTVLDVGCGDNTMWSDKVVKVTTLDNRLSYDGEICIPDVIGEAEHLPFKDKSFDIVCEAEIIEHVVSPRQVLAEAVRVAKLKTIITVPWEQVWSKINKPFTNPTHLRFYEPKTLETELEYFNLPFQICPITFEGFVWLAAEIYISKG